MSAPTAARAYAGADAVASGGTPSPLATTAVE